MLGKRVLFGAIGILYIILMLYLGGWFFNLSVLLVALIGAGELYSAFMKKGFHPVRWAGFLSIMLFYVQFIYFDGRYAMASITFAVLLFIVIPVFDSSVKPVDSALTTLGFLYPGLPLLFALLLKNQYWIHDNVLLIISLFAAFSTDTFAYFIGRKFGKNKLCPSISPNKTVEGSIGGLAGCMITILLVGFVLGRVYNNQADAVHLIVIGLLGGTFSQAGDLAASVIKRYCGIKDYGSILPGHGGIMDRIDSLLFVMPLVYTYCFLFLGL